MEPVLMRWAVEWGEVIGRGYEGERFPSLGERRLRVFLTAKAGRVCRHIGIGLVPPQIRDYYMMVDRKTRSGLRIVRTN